MMTAHLRLPDSLALIRSFLYSPAGSQALGAAEDPLHLNLPPVLSTREGGAPTPDALRVMGALYLQAEMEEAGVIPVAELLANARGSLSLTSTRAAGKLEVFAERSRQWYDRAHRSQVFARLFGLGPATGSEAGNTVNGDFQQRLATLCLILVRYGEDYRWSRVVGSTREALLRQTATDLLVNLGLRQFGNTLIAARLIQEQLQHAIDILNDPDIGVLFQARGMWDLLRKILGDETPDLGRLLTRGQSGLRILDWLASVIPQLSESTLSRPLVPTGSPVFVWAAQWLEATGVQVAAPATRRVA